MAKNIVVLLWSAAVLVGCIAPMPVSMPPPPKKKMCVAHDCREMGAVDGGNTIRGHRDDPED